MDTHRTGQLGNTADRQFHLLAGCHNQVAELINDDDDVRQEAVTVLRIQLAVDKLRVIFLDVTASRVLQELVTVVHFHTQRVQRLHHLRHVGDDGILSVGQLGQEVTLNRRVDGKFHLLRVNNDELQLTGVFLVEQGSHDGIQSHRLTLPCRTGHQHVGRFGQIHHEYLVGNGLAKCYRQVEGRFLELLAGQNGTHGHDVRVRVRHLNTDGTLARNRGDDTDTQCRKTQGDVVLQVTDFRDTYPFRRRNLI